MADWIEQDGIWTRTEGRMVYTVAPAENGGYTMKSEKTGCAPNSLEDFNSIQSLGFQLTLDAAIRSVDGHIDPPKTERVKKVCPSCGASEKSRDWRFVPGPGGGGWMCDCGAMWRSWNPEDVLDRKED